MNIGNVTTIAGQAILVVLAMALIAFLGLALFMSAVSQVSFWAYYN